MKPKILLLTFLLSFSVVLVQARSLTLYNAKKSDPVKKSDINGYVVHSQTHKPLDHVSITAYINSKKEKVAATDEHGNYSFDDLKSGSYKLVFEKSGFKKVTKENVYIKSDDAYQLNVEMIATDDFEFLPGPFHLVDF